MTFAEKYGMDDLVNRGGLPDLISKSQQRNVALHPESVDGKQAF